MTDFITIKVHCSPNLSNYLISWLFEFGFDSFQELADGFEGSCEKKKFDEGKIKKYLSNYSAVSYIIKEQEKINWNQEWEKNYDPIIIHDTCIVRATFHDPQPQFHYEIIITPKMSFGTGHHATTHQILNYQLHLDHLNKNVLDVGTGTGVLAIMAQKRGASNITSTDIDDWCIENSRENFSLNKVTNVQLIQGQIAEVNKKNFDIIIANINKNILLEQIEMYADRLKIGGELILSGFYEEDIDDLLAEGKKYNLQKKEFTVKNRWAMLGLIKHLA